MILDREAVKAILPHRDPILLVDRLVVSEPGRSGDGFLRLAEADPVWGRRTVRDYADEMILEGAAQFLGIVLATAADRGDDDDRLLLSFDQVEFHDPIDWNEPIEMSVRVLSRLGAISAGEFSARQAHRRLADGRVVVKGG